MDIKMASEVVPEIQTKQSLKNSKFHMDATKKKLPRPIVFWSDNEKDAFRRNRVVQTRFNMILDDISNQRETSRRNIRYEAHKFRQKSGKYFQHPAATSPESQPLGYVISTPIQSARYQQSDDVGKEDGDLSDSDSVEELESFSPRSKGIITRAKKPAVKFSMFKEVYSTNTDRNDKVEKEPKIDQKCNENETITSLNLDNHVRSLSAFSYREIPELPGTQTRRQKSAFPSLRMTKCNDESFSKDSSGRFSSSSSKAVSGQTEQKTLRSETFFDKSKAAYQLRQELRRMARMRKQGVTTSTFTLQDALNLEREKYVKSNDKVLEYIKRLEAERRAENALINRWVRPEVEGRLL